VLHASSIPRRPALLALLVATLLGAAALLAIAPKDASAGPRDCNRGDFCLFYSYGFSGGLYHFSGSDRNLDNDRFESGAVNVTVGDSAESAWNNGRATNSGLDDVVLFAGRNWRGAGACLRLGQKGDLRGGFVNNVQSSRWVTPQTCNRYHSAIEGLPYSPDFSR
jgi:hypothetical protein